MSPRAEDPSEDSPHYRAGELVPTMLGRSRELRRSQTSTEQLAWHILRSQNFRGLKFRRQHQIGDYIVDFYCDQYKLIVELDGPVHGNDEVQQRDERKEVFLRQRGFNFLRVPNRVVIKNTKDFLEILGKRIDDIGE